MSRMEDVSREMLVFLHPCVSSRVSGFPVVSPCLWGKLQNISFSKVSKQVVHSFCVAGMVLCDIPTCLITRRKCQNWRKSRTKCSFFCARVSRLESGFSVASPCLWGKLQNLSFSKVSKQVVMSFCVAGVVLCDIPTCCIPCRKFFCVAGATMHSTLYTPHSTTRYTLHTPHSSLRTLHSTLLALHSTLDTPHSPHYTPHSTLYIPHSTIYTLDSSLHTQHFTLHTLHSTLYTFYFPPHTPHSTLYTPHSTLYIPHSSTLYTHHTPHSTLYTPHSFLYTPHSTVHAPHTTLYTLHFTLYTPHSTLHTLHFTHSTLITCTSLAAPGDMRAQSLFDMFQ